MNHQLVATARTERRGYRRSELEEDSEPFPHVGEDFSGSGCSKLRAPGFPIQILDVIGEDDARDSAVVGQGNLERVAFRMTCDRAGNRKAGYHTSFPSLPSQSRSSWRFCGVMRRTSSSSE